MYRLLDAAANRAGEALRVVEDYARFVLDDVYLTAQWKSLRHDLTTALESIPMSLRCAVRNTQHDVGTDLSLPEERGRKDLWDLAGANLSRLQQALRSLEETTKLIEENLAVRWQRQCRSRRTVAGVWNRFVCVFWSMVVSRPMIFAIGCGCWWKRG